MATLIDMSRELNEIFHELSPKERMKAMRNTMGTVARRIRKEAVTDLKNSNYGIKPRHKKEMRTRTGPMGLEDNIIAVPYRRAIGFHVTVTSRKRVRAGEHGKFDHFNRWKKWKPAARWLSTGTKKQDARPFMKNASDTLDRYENEIKEIFEKRINRIAKKHNGA